MFPIVGNPASLSSERTANGGRHLPDSHLLASVGAEIERAGRLWICYEALNEEEIAGERFEHMLPRPG
ncbi:MAG: hypothetical protein R3D05_12115 [Dongiaceae bacterium]